jgi:acetyl esterase/lipase
VKIILAFLTWAAAILSITPFLRPGNPYVTILLWPFKLMAGALSTVLAVISGLGALAGLVRRDWTLASVGAIGAGLAVSYAQRVTRPHDGFAAAFGADWESHIPATLQSRLLPSRWSPVALAPQSYVWQRNVEYSRNRETGEPLLADLWQSTAGVRRTGLGVIYIHGGGWQYGSKDLATRPLFQRLVSEGHTVLDIEYTLCPEADIQTQVTEVKEAILWLKARGSGYGVDPERIVLMGGSAGGHLALLAAYTPNHDAFQPAPDAGDTSVRAVVSYYPPVDLVMRDEDIGSTRSLYKGSEAQNMIERAALGFLDWMLQMASFRRGEAEGAGDSQGDRAQFHGYDYIHRLVGCTPEESPETYELLSPAAHVGSPCPATLLLQGSDDVFQLAPAVRRLQQSLRGAGVPSVLVEFPHSEHAFDLILPQISPAAQAATYDVERFLALMV